jgi:hypothetical protein
MIVNSPQIRRLSSQVSVLVENHNLQTSKQTRFKDGNNDLSMR